ncbi:MAG: hypothetical protein EOO16_14795 [Chitinophagaceae bacterium]|nr:MAG: hypothetical protein EOO16_14795 [Chitinophagaceae bacterium]
MASPAPVAPQTISVPVSAVAPSTELATIATTTATTAPLYSLALNWAGRANSTYGITQATSDFKNIAFWGTNTTLTNGTLTTTLLRNKIGPSGGNVSRVNVPDGSEYTVQFDMMFDANFDWSSGGKVGFGCLIGNGYTGGQPGWDGAGGSARVMWYKGTGGRVYLKPYVYHKDQKGTYGDDFGKSYPSTGSLVKGKWYRVMLYVRSNTGSNTNGAFKMTVDGVTVVDMPIRWTTQDSKRLINNICLETFRGGAETYWQSATDGKVSYNNVSWKLTKY